MIERMIEKMLDEKKVSIKFTIELVDESNLKYLDYRPAENLI